MELSKDEMILTMLYSPGNRPGLISALNDMQGQLTSGDADLRDLVASLLPKLEAMTDEEFEGVSSCPDIY